MKPSKQIVAEAISVEDARLIAAAPELLEALRVALDDIEHLMMAARNTGTQHYADVTRLPVERIQACADRGCYVLTPDELIGSNECSIDSVVG